MYQVRKGKIKGFHGNWLSGLATLEIEDSESGLVEQVHCDNAPTVRALEGCFGSIIGDAHTAGVESIADEEIYWSPDPDMPVEFFACFTPVEEASEKLVELFESEREEQIG